jgi:hypothetical protein
MAARAIHITGKDSLPLEVSPSTATSCQARALLEISQALSSVSSRYTLERKHIFKLKGLTLPPGDLNGE